MMTSVMREKGLSDKKIFILTPNPFPQGNVATNRIWTYAKSLAKKGYYVHVLVLKGTELPILAKKNEKNGFLHGVYYSCMAASVLWDTNWTIFKKIALYIIGVFRAIFIIVRERPAAIVMYTNDFFYIFIFYFFSRLVRANYFIDKSEYPVVYRKKSGISRSIYMCVFRLFDGIIVMTHELKKYYSIVKREGAKIFHLPMSVDSERFSLVRENLCSEDYFCCVFGVHNRDCISDTILAFDVLCEKIPNSQIKLKLVGDYDGLQGRENVQKIVSKCKYKERIVFTGVVNSADVPGILASAFCLITTPVEYKSGGFPTKLGEYLATGRPVIATEVGEIPYYLKDMESCFLAKPTDVNKIADLMFFVVQNRIFAESVGGQGREVAMSAFNVDTYVDDLGKFLMGN